MFQFDGDKPPLATSAASLSKAIALTHSGTFVLASMAWRMRCASVAAEKLNMKHG